MILGSIRVLHVCTYSPVSHYCPIIYIYIYIYIYTFICIVMRQYRPRMLPKDTVQYTRRKTEMCIYIYIYIHTNIYILLLSLYSAGGRVECSRGAAGACRLAVRCGGGRLGRSYCSHWCILPFGGLAYAPNPKR